ncbi:adipocyte plasma membrane-associated protein isoform X4 [Syngnathus acus]|uniref:adipocyte plasma membrane-associated protein isoform X4 n=1 Tax=Syngnathus acus TaxID=161584 RepID=UPI001885B1CD|nr:adipocyte plasma membrane-associated protein isoform X4 [Syngnathus acus]
MNETAGLRFRRQNRHDVISDHPADRVRKGNGAVTFFCEDMTSCCAGDDMASHCRTYSGRVFRATLLSVGGLLLLPLLVIVLILESPIQPDVLVLKEPPAMSGCWEANAKLRLARRLYEDAVAGPESIANIGESAQYEVTCGRPLGIRVGPNGTLFVADAYLGVFEVNPTTGESTRLVAGGQEVGGRKLLFINDLAVTQDGKKVYFTSSSSRWQRRNYLHLIMEASADGRVLEYDTESGELSVVMDNLRFPNGIQLLPDEESVLVAETTVARIRRVHVAGLNKGGMDTFVDNLPGFPDNIRPSSSGGYWVAMSTVRPNPGFSMLDFLSQRPWIKKLLFKLFSQDAMMKFVPRYSLVAELHDGGICSRSFHDPDGLVAAYVSEAHEHDGSLYLGSFRSPYLAKLDLSLV